MSCSRVFYMNDKNVLNFKKLNIVKNNVLICNKFIFHESKNIYMLNDYISQSFHKYYFVLIQMSVWQHVISDCLKTFSLCMAWPQNTANIIFSFSTQETNSDLFQRQEADQLWKRQKAVLDLCSSLGMTWNIFKVIFFFFFYYTQFLS